MVALSLLHSLTRPVGPEFVLEIMEHYLNRHPTACIQQLALFLSI